MSYLKEVLGTFEEQPIEILCTALLIWAIFPAIIFGVRGILLLVSVVSLDIFIRSFSNLFLPWWASIIINFGKFILEYLAFIILTLILVYHKVIEPINFRGLIERLRRL